ncbi:MAG: HAMP domain-containing protein [gamma proteobacterium symbiont of Phacoides pectinatus]
MAWTDLRCNRADHRALTVQPFAAALALVKERGAGYIDLAWPEAEQPIRSYVKRFQPWGWVIGAGRSPEEDSLFIAEVRYRLATGGVVLLLVLAASWWLGRAITGPLRHVMREVEAISRGEGDLTRRLDVRGHDELSHLAASFNHLMERIQRMLKSVAGSSMQLSASFAELSLVSDDTDRAVLKQQEETHLVINAINELAASVREVAENTARAADAALKADDQALSGRHMVNGNSQAMEKLAEEVEQAALVIQELEQEAVGIGSVLAVIQSIAEQTNLLALNAAIEAARAGDQGRGFAVVADEVRTLAQRTQAATTQIQDAIARLQERTGRAVAVMARGRSSADDGLKKATRAGELLDSNSASVAVIRDFNTQIASATEEQAAVTAEVGSNLNCIADLAKNTASGAEATDKATIHLTEEVEALQGRIMQFQLGGRMLDLESAKSKHQNWKVRLRAFLNNETMLTADQAASHTHCEFGRWYYSDGLHRFGDIAAMREIEAPHLELHKLIRAIIEAKNSGNTELAEELYFRVEPLSQRIVVLMEQAEAQAADAGSA